MANGTVINVDKLTLEMRKILLDYASSISEDVTVSAQGAAKECVKQLKQTSPKETGKYAKSWKYDKIVSRVQSSFVIYNSKRWQLTHLLENGHGYYDREGRYHEADAKTAHEHIRPAEQAAIKAFENKLLELIK